MIAAIRMMAPVKILYTIPNFITAGSGQAMLNVIERLHRGRFSPAIAVLKKGGDLEKRIHELGIPLMEAPFVIAAKPYLSLPFRARRAAAVFRGGGFRLWHSFHYADDYTESLIARWSGARWMFTKKNMGWGSRGWKVRCRLAVRIAAQNSTMPQTFLQPFKAKVKVIPPTVDTQAYRPERSPVWRQRLGIPDGEALVGHCAHFVPVKNHLFLLRALARCRERFHVLFAGRLGESDYARQVVQLAEELGLKSRVHFSRAGFGYS